MLCYVQELANIGESTIDAVANSVAMASVGRNAAGYMLCVRPHGPADSSGKYGQSFQGQLNESFNSNVRLFISETWPSPTGKTSSVFYCFVSGDACFSVYAVFCSPGQQSLASIDSLSLFYHYTVSATESHAVACVHFCRRFILIGLTDGSVYALCVRNGELCDTLSALSNLTEAQQSAPSPTNPSSVGCLTMIFIVTLDSCVVQMDAVACEEPDDQSHALLISASSRTKFVLVTTDHTFAEVSEPVQIGKKPRKDTGHGGCFSCTASSSLPECVYVVRPSSKIFTYSLSEKTVLNTIALADTFSERGAIPRTATDVQPLESTGSSGQPLEPTSKELGTLYRVTGPVYLSVSETTVTLLDLSVPTVLAWYDAQSLCSMTTGCAGECIADKVMRVSGNVVTIAATVNAQSASPDDKKADARIFIALAIGRPLLPADKSARDLRSMSSLPSEEPTPRIEEALMTPQPIPPAQARAAVGANIALTKSMDSMTVTSMVSSSEAERDHVSTPKGTLSDAQHGNDIGITPEKLCAMLSTSSPDQIVLASAALLPGPSTAADPQVIDEDFMGSFTIPTVDTLYVSPLRYFADDDWREKDASAVCFADDDIFVATASKAWTKGGLLALLRATLAKADTDTPQLYKFLCRFVCTEVSVIEGIPPIRRALHLLRDEVSSSTVIDILNDIMHVDAQVSAFQFQQIEKFYANIDALNIILCHEVEARFANSLFTDAYVKRIGSLTVVLYAACSAISLPLRTFLCHGVDTVTLREYIDPDVCSVIDLVLNAQTPDFVDRNKFSAAARLRNDDPLLRLNTVLHSSINESLAAKSEVSYLQILGMVVGARITYDGPAIRALYATVLSRIRQKTLSDPYDVAFAYLVSIVSLGRNVDSLTLTYLSKTLSELQTRFSSDDALSGLSEPGRKSILLMELYTRLPSITQGSDGVAEEYFQFRLVAFNAFSYVSSPTRAEACERGMLSVLSFFVVYDHISPLNRCDLVVSSDIAENDFALQCISALQAYSMEAAILAVHALLEWVEQVPLPAGYWHEVMQCVFHPLLRLLFSYCSTDSFLSIVMSTVLAHKKFVALVLRQESFESTVAYLLQHFGRKSVLDSFVKPLALDGNNEVVLPVELLRSLVY